ncbi:MAG: hypothetical protein KGK11_11110, partial [Sphingomonadales bacterium]|nr:hypothetical protein [Sphingomonadales bacterium]
LEHRAEKWEPVFRISDAITKNLTPAGLQRAGAAGANTREKKRVPAPAARETGTRCTQHTTSAATRGQGVFARAVLASKMQSPQA